MISAEIIIKPPFPGWEFELLTSQQQLLALPDLPSVNGEPLDVRYFWYEGTCSFIFSGPAQELEGKSVTLKVLDPGMTSWVTARIAGWQEFDSHGRAFIVFAKLGPEFRLEIA